MILRRIVGRSMSEALARVEREVGADALIVESREEHGVATILARKNEPAPRPAPPAPPPELRAFKPGFRPLAARLLAAGLTPRLLAVVHRAIDGLDPHLLSEGAPALPGVVRRVVAGLLPLPGEPGRIVALVGPTGVGKTTTLAKLAARDTLEGDLRVGIVSTDTYRIAAVEQLRAFADMLDVPFEVAFTPHDLRLALERLQDRDRIYIDTSGRSPRDRSSLQAMRGFFRGLGAAVHLCLPAAGRRQDLDLALQAFRGFEPQCLVVTKWDETATPGEAVSLAIERNLPIRFVTDGQRVPEDLWPAASDRIAGSLLENA